MIGYLTGKIISKRPTQIIMDVNGVGYKINISINTFEKISENKEAVSLHTYLSVREDSLDLYGFFSESEKDMFQLLISISGIGPKLALGILSGIQIDELKEALKAGNISRIIAVPGVGRKTAERLMVELRDKVDSIAEEIGTLTGKSYSVKNDAVTALTNLGYNHKTADQAVRKVLESSPKISIEGLIKETLALLNK